MPKSVHLSAKKSNIIIKKPIFSNFYAENLKEIYLISESYKFSTRYKVAL